MAVKIIGGILIVLCGTFTGIYFSERSRRETMFLRQYILFLGQIRSMVEYAGESIGDIMLKVHSVPLMDHLIGEFTGRLSSGEDMVSAWTKSVENSLDRKEFDSADTVLLLNFCEGFGEMGPAEEGSRIQMLIGAVTARLEQKEKDSLVKQRLYRTVGTFCGVLTAVVFL